MYVVAVLLLALGLPSLIGAETLLFTSFSLRGAKDRVSPFDYEVMGGVAFSSPVWQIRGVVQRERQNGRMYDGWEGVLIHQRRWAEGSIRWLDSEERDLRIGSFSLLGKPTSWIGFGLTRQTLKKDRGGAAWLGKIALNGQIEMFSKAYLSGRVEYEVNPNRQRWGVYTEIQGVKVGPFALIPFYSLDRVQAKGQQVASLYQGKVKLEIKL